MIEMTSAPFCAPVSTPGSGRRTVSTTSAPLATHPPPTVAPAAV